jgi:hypothetical protein
VEGKITQKGFNDFKEGMKNISVGATDTHWQWSKVCDIKVTPLGIWTFIGTEETLEGYFNYLEVGNFKVLLSRVVLDLVFL